MTADVRKREWMLWVRQMVRICPDLTEEWKKVTILGVLRDCEPDWTGRLPAPKIWTN